MRHRQRGLSLIEVMIAISIGMAILGVSLALAIPARESAKVGRVVNAIRELRVEIERAFLPEGGYSQLSPANLRKRTVALEHLFDAASQTFQTEGLNIDVQASSYRAGGPGAYGDSYSVAVTAPKSLCAGIAVELAPEAVAASVTPQGGATIQGPVGVGANLAWIAEACSQASMATVQLHFF